MLSTPEHRRGLISRRMQFTPAAADTADKVFGDSKLCSSHRIPDPGWIKTDLSSLLADKRIDFPGSQRRSSAVNRDSDAFCRLRPRVRRSR